MILKLYERNCKIAITITYCLPIILACLQDDGIISDDDEVILVFVSSF